MGHRLWPFWKYDRFEHIVPFLNCWPYFDRQDDARFYILSEQESPPCLLLLGRWDMSHVINIRGQSKSITEQEHHFFGSSIRNKEACRTRIWYCGLPMAHFAKAVQLLEPTHPGEDDEVWNHFTKQDLRIQKGRERKLFNQGP